METLSEGPLILHNYADFASTAITVMAVLDPSLARGKVIADTDGLEPHSHLDSFLPTAKGLGPVELR